MKTLIIDFSNILICLIFIYLMYMLCKYIDYQLNRIDFNLKDFFTLKIKKTGLLGYVFFILVSISIGITLGLGFIKIIENIQKYNIIFKL